MPPSLAVLWSLFCPLFCPLDRSDAERVNSFTRPDSPLLEGHKLKGPPGQCGAHCPGDVLIVGRRGDYWMIFTWPGPVSAIWATPWEFAVNLPETRTCLPTSALISGNLA